MTQNQERLQSGERVLLIHYGEIGLKSGNRRRFEKKLQSNIKATLPDEGEYQVLRLRGRIVVRTGDREPEDLLEPITFIPGIVSVSPAVVSRTDYDDMEEKGKKIARDASFETFSIRASRAHKEFHLTSQEINEKLGDVVRIQSGADVDLDHPEWTLYLEVLQKRTFLYADEKRGVGGLPVSSSGRLLSLLSGGIDSPVSSYLMMKRGCRLGFVHFHSFPLTDRGGQEKAEELVRSLNRFQNTSRLFLVPFADCQREIVASCPANLRIILYRRFMMRISERLAEKKDYLGLVSGENLGQVSSQTLTNLHTIESVLEKSLFRPLMGFDKQEIVDLAREINTYETSIKPHQDCCSYLMPEQPATGSSPRELREAESELSIDQLVEDTVDQTETRVFR